jgi:hypothetical protein
MDPLFALISAVVVTMGAVLGCFALLLPEQSRLLRGAGIYLSVISFLTGCGPFLYLWPGEGISRWWFVAFCVPMALGLLAFALCLRGRNLGT